MKAGRSLQDLAAEITRQQNSKRDFIASTDKLEVILAGSPQPDGVTRPNLKIGDFNAFPINKLTHGQIAEHTGIPKGYYDRMLKEAPELLGKNINEWFHRFPAPRMVRLLDGNVRAFLSDRFALLDNFDFANAALPIIRDRNLDIVSCEITETRLYIKVIDKTEFQVPVGYRMGDGSHKIFDVCCPALILSNSEVGFGRLVVETGVYTKACTNLSWFSSGGFKRTHIGARHRMTEGLSVDDLDKVMSDETKRKTQEALWLQVRDVVASAFDKTTIQRRSEQLEAAGNNTFAPSKAGAIVEVAGDRFGLNEIEKNSVLDHLMAGGNLSQYGLHAAITRAAQDVADYDRATEFEYLGGKVIDLTKTEWKQVEALAA